jgi:hypothetical protein
MISPAQFFLNCGKSGGVDELSRLIILYPLPANSTRVIHGFDISIAWNFLAQYTAFRFFQTLPV